jgi:PhnB protein
MAQVSPIPPGMTAVTPHLVCRGAAAAIDFYKQAFGAIELARLPGPDGRLMHGMINIGGAAIMLVDEYLEHPEQCALSPLALKGSPVTIHLYVPDVDATLAQAVAAGARLTMPAADMFWGDRYGRLEDPFGHQWSVATHIRDVSPEEIVAAMGKGCPDAAA